MRGIHKGVAQRFPASIPINVEITVYGQHLGDAVARCEFRDGGIREIEGNICVTLNDREYVV